MRFTKRGRLLLRETRGFESLPVALLLGILMAACTLGLGFRCIESAQRISRHRQAIEGFNSFIERARMVSAGGLGNGQRVELDLGGGEIVIDSNLVQLWMDGELVRSEALQLPVHAKDSPLVNGVYAIELKRGIRGYFLEVWKE